MFYRYEHYMSISHMALIVAIVQIELASIDELKQRITSALDNVTGDILQRVWQELNYQLDACCQDGAHIEHL